MNVNHQHGHQNGRQHTQPELHTGDSGGTGDTGPATAPEPKATESAATGEPALGDQRSWDSPTSPTSPPSRGPRRRLPRRAAIIAVAAAAVLATGGGVVYAASDDDAPATVNSGTTGPVVGSPGGGPAGRMGGLGGGRALHGEFVVATDSGTETRLLQTGEVTELADTSITVVSSDDYAKTYTITSSTSIDHGRQTLSDLTTGDTVTVVAKTADDTATAMLIDDRATHGRPHGRPHGQRAEPPGTDQDGSDSTD